MSHYLLPSLTGRTRVGLPITGSVWVGLLLILALTIVSCKPSMPSGVIPEGDMEDILYDYLIAQSLRSQTGDKYNEQRMYNDILEKYDYTQAEFDSSMVYYTRHYRLINKIYNNIEERLMEKAVLITASKAPTSLSKTLISMITFPAHIATVDSFVWEAVYLKTVSLMI